MKPRSSPSRLPTTRGGSDGASSFEPGLRTIAELGTTVDWHHSLNGEFFLIKLGSSRLVTIIPHRHGVRLSGCHARSKHGAAGVGMISPVLVNTRTARIPVAHELTL
jgi:hypothetical protein